MDAEGSRSPVREHARNPEAALAGGRLETETVNVPGEVGREACIRLEAVLSRPNKQFG